MLLNLKLNMYGTMELHFNNDIEIHLCYNIAEKSYNEHLKYTGELCYGAKPLLYRVASKFKQ